MGEVFGVLGRSGFFAACGYRALFVSGAHSVGRRCGHRHDAVGFPVVSGFAFFPQKGLTKRGKCDIIKIRGNTGDGYFLPK